MKKLVFVLAYLLLAIPFYSELVESAQAGTIYVDAGATGANNGSNWTNAYKYAQDGLTAAVANDQVWVAHGTYTPDSNSAVPNGTGDRTATFQLKNNVAIYGGFPTGGGSRDPSIYVTFLSGDINVPDDNNDNSYHVVTGSGTDSTAILDGFTITKGKAEGEYPDCYGGGMCNSSGSPTLTNCTFIGNGSLASLGGGGMYNYDSDPNIVNCTFIGNVASSYGGGMLNDYSNPTLANCTFSDSWTAIGGGMFNLYNSNPTITNCTFSGNSADGFGGGICNWCYSSPALTDCTFSDNSAGYDGGGMANYYESSPKLTNCTFNGNLALNCAGGMFNYHNNCPTVTNCTFVSNNAGNGSAVFCDSEGQAFPSILKISNSILWDGGNEIWNNDGSTIIITHSDVQDGWPGLGNIDADPCFVDADANDYHLKSEGWRWDAQRKVWTWDDITSRCIDAGNPGSPLGDELLSVPDDPDNIWGQNLRIDMGAFGGTAEASIPPYDWALLSDATNDGISDLSDLDILSSLWLNTAEQLYADFNRDGVIDLFDFALLAQDWLEQTTWH